MDRLSTLLAQRSPGLERHAETLDRFLKPELYAALKRVGLKAPKGWELAEGRRAKNDDTKGTKAEAPAPPLFAAAERAA